VLPYRLVKCQFHQRSPLQNDNCPDTRPREAAAAASPFEGDGNETTAPASIEILSRMSSGHCPTIAVEAIASPITRSSNGYEAGFSIVSLR
jgi:hypothetical protein